MRTLRAGRAMPGAHRVLLETTRRVVKGDEEWFSGSALNPCHS